MANTQDLAPLPVEVRHRFREQGHASILFEVLIGSEPWLMKVPKRGTGGAESMSAREFIYCRFADRLGLPVVPIVPVTASPETNHQLSAIDLYAGQDVFTATPLLNLGRKVTYWSEISESHRAALVFWENATTVHEGDKIKPHAPRDFFHTSSTSPHSPSSVMMLDYESRESVWDIASSREPVANDFGLVKGTGEATAGVPISVLRSAGDNALASLDDAQWDEVVAGADLFLRGLVPDLRRVMRKRVEQTISGLAL